MAYPSCPALMSITVPGGPEPAEPLLTSGEAARLLGISRRTLSRYAAEGRLRPATVIPGVGRVSYRWSADDLRAQWRELQRERER